MNTPKFDNMAKSLLLIFILFGHINRNLACTNQTTVSCSTRDSATRVIYVWRDNPQGNCTLVQIGNDKFIFDPVMINSVWITLINTDAACIANIATKAQTIFTMLNYDQTQEVVILNLTPQFFRMVVVPRNCSANCTVNSFSADMETKLRTANLALYPIFTDLNQFGPMCFNGGNIDPTYKGAGYKCICDGNITYVGPMCEYLETVLNTPLPYFNVFRNAEVINLRFSIYSNGIAGNISLLTIKNGAYQKVVEVIIIESSVNIKIEDNKLLNIIMKVDNQEWYDIVVTVRRQNVTMWVNNLNTSGLFSSQSTADFRAFYLILYEAPGPFRICMKNVMLNGKLLNLNNLKYLSGCADRCFCSSNQECYCKPFVAIINTNCYCKLGYLSSGSGCISNNLTLYQIRDSTLATFTTIVDPFTRLDFGFQTLSINGSLLSVQLSVPNVNINIQIVNSNLTLNVTNQTSRAINYNVSNGQIHFVTLHVKPYSVQLILDYSLNYSRSLINWSSYYTSGTASVTAPTAASLTIGTMQKPYNSLINNLTTCFSSIRTNLISNNPSDTFPNTNSNLSTQCVSGPRCRPGGPICPLNQECNDSQWQYTQCICVANFTSVNSTCIFNQCLRNPCQNNGQCTLNSTTGNYSCNCTSGFTGTNCESTTITSASLWWIAVLVVLILLVIILIVLFIYCCCYRNREPVTNPYIFKINENIVTYNDQAGESDYTGPAIDLAKLKAASNRNGGPMYNPSNNQIPILMNKKEEFDQNNNDLILDHPLEYGYEGNDSDNDSVSSIGSKSANSQLGNAEDYNLGDILNKP